MRAKPAIETRSVLARFYRGAMLTRAEVLTHAFVAGAAKTLCGAVPEEHLADPHATDPKSAPTCAVCLRRREPLRRMNMKRLNDGTWIDFDTRIGTFDFRDDNGEHGGSVVVDGEFWRVVVVNLPNAGLKPAAARKLAALLTLAADIAEREERAIAAQDAL